MNDDIILYLPWPPTINDYYGVIKRGKVYVKYIKKAGKEYRKKVAEAINEQSVLQTLDQRLYVEPILFPPDRRRRDLDNYMKGLLDACTHADLWEDDEQIDQLPIYRGVVVKGGAVKLVISEAGPLIPWDL